MTTDFYIKGQLAEFCWREAGRYGGSNNMLAVAYVIRNRVQAGWHGGDWLEVLAHAPGCSAREDDIMFGPQQPNLRDDSFRLLLRAVDDIYAGMSIDRFTADPEGKGALYFAELNDVTSSWFRRNILACPDEHPRIANVGPVVFFR